VGAGGTRSTAAGSGAGGARSGAAGGIAGAGGTKSGAGEGLGVSSAGAGAGAGGAGAGAGPGSAGSPAAGAGAADGGAGAPASSAFRCPAGPFGSPVPSGATAQRVEGIPPADAFNDKGNTRTNIEGAVWIGEKLYVSEFPFLPAPTSRILALDPARNAVTIALASAGANGLAVDANGNLIAADHQLGAIVRMAFPLGTPEVLVGSYEGQRFNSPNDLAVRSDGTIYFSDPDYQAPATKPQTQTRVYRLAPGSREATVIDATRPQPNGVTLSPDERTLYVSASDGIVAYPVFADGSITAGTGARVAGFNGGSDGLGIDCAGNLYATASERIVILSPQGSEIGSIPIDQAESVTNIAFGGPEHKTLFVTSMGTGIQRGVFRIDLNVPGMPY
jgi:gluconolactonase